MNCGCICRWSGIN